MTWASFRACSCTHWSKFRNSRKKPCCQKDDSTIFPCSSPLTGHGQVEEIFFQVGGLAWHAVLVPVPLLGSCCPGLDASGWLVAWFGSAVEAIRLKTLGTTASYSSHALCIICCLQGVSSSASATHAFFWSCPNCCIAFTTKRVIENSHSYRATPLFNMEISHQLRHNLEESTISYIYSWNIGTPRCLADWHISTTD